QRGEDGENVPVKTERRAGRPGPAQPHDGICALRAGRRARQRVALPAEGLPLPRERTRGDRDAADVDGERNTLQLTHGELARVESGAEPLGEALDVDAVRVRPIVTLARL